MIACQRSNQNDSHGDWAHKMNKL